MRTKGQIEIIETHLSSLSPELSGIYRELIQYLSDLGYGPKRQRSAIVFNCPWHGKQIAKTGFDRKGEPFFALRFSACREYSPRFEKIVGDWVAGPKYRAAPCTQDACGFCKGKPEEHTYGYTMPDGEVRRHCGSIALAIPGLNRSDLPEVKRLMEEEHRFLMEHEAALSV